MTNPEDRRRFLARGAAATGLFVAGSAAAQDTVPKQSPPATGSPHAGHAAPGGHAGHAGHVMPGRFPRTQPGVGGPVGSPEDRGRLVPGLRAADQSPVPIHAPDLKRLEWKLVDGVKEFHLTPEPVRRELLPGFWIDTYGFNGDMPGPTIEINQGDRVRIIVQNRLPEPTSMHWHGLEVPFEMDGVPHLVQDLIPPGGRFVYEFTVHQEGTFFYHSHVGMQETMGMVGLFIVHPPKAHQPVVDRDFALIAQEFQIRPNSTVPDTLAMEWNYLTFNGRCGPLTTPLLCKLGERVRIRFVNFSVIDHHPLHLHGVTFWVTGTEGGRMPEPSWYPSNNVLVGVAQVREIEFIANNPGDWIMHCHMFHHMMNSMTSQAGPLVRRYSTPEQMRVRGYPQVMLGMEMPEMTNMPDMKDMPGKGPAMKHDMKHNKPADQIPNGKAAPPPGGGHDQHKAQHGNHTEAAADPAASSGHGDHYGMAAMSRVEGRREAIGMRPGWSMGVEGLTTVVRILPPETYNKIMGSTGHEGHQMHDMKK